MRENSFTKKMSKKSNTELENIFANKSDYTNEALQAVIWELENRNLIEKADIPSLEFPISHNNEESSIPKENIKNNENPLKKSETPTLYSKTTIQGFTIFFSTFFGVILLMSNLKEMNKPKARMEVLVFGITYAIFSSFLLNYLPPIFFISIIFNLIGYVILVEYFWNKNLGKDLKYEKKQIWKPLIVSILFSLIMLFILISNNEIPGIQF